MKIAIIGSTGFVGLAFTEELVNRSQNIIGISRDIENSGKNNLIDVQMAI
ncbi:MULTISPECIES: hypothetical protein [unclassified Pedobacter]|nr:MULTISPECIES: hypothetical protein [unclassified Pedobacter]NII81134.1 putative NADH-flavin reductase [Pedobacter sp. SG908]NMN35151.1 putative NADH-flavin reductase [Pedobacter sp. SG918]